ncbi:MAG TPA: hypothetical protein VNO30_48800 [Kofleriaceae bacterium]|nr:hypothetical protein [Kofleriaceae bacterium]
MNMSEFLSRKGVDLPSVVTGVEAAVGLHADDVLLGVGSIVEGLGNSKSDIDLLLITARDQRELPSRDELGLVISRCLIDLRILRTSWIDEVIGRLRRCGQARWAVTHPVTFTPDERSLLHRLLHGRVLNGVRQAQIEARMPPRADLARLKLQVARQMGRTIQVDMVGYWESGDYRSLVFAAQELLGHAVDALTAGYGLTNPTPKWRHRLLDLLPASWAHALVLRPTQASASQQYWRLHRAPAEPDERTALEHAFRIATFTRAVFAWAEGHLVGPSRPIWQPDPWPALARRPDDILLPYLDFDVDFAFGEDRVTLARLNEFGETVEVTPRELAVTLLCDGTTTAREAEALLQAGDGAAAAPRVGQLLTRLEQASFTVPAMSR